MPLLLKFGLFASGSGIALCIVAFVSGGVGICTSTTLGILMVETGVCLVPVGVLLCIAAGVAAVFKRKPNPAA